MINIIEMASQLKGDYKVAFEKADLYISFNGIDEKIAEDRMMNLYDLLIEAQHDEKPVEKIVGEDLEAFCKEYFTDEEKNVFVDIAKRLFSISKVLLIFSLLDLFIFNGGQKNILTATSDMTPYIFGIALAVVLDVIFSVTVKPLIFKKKIKPYVYYFGIVAVWIGCIIAGANLLAGFEIKLLTWPFVVVSGAYIVIYLLITTLKRYKATGKLASYDKEEKQVKKEFNEEISDKYLEKSIASGMVSRYKRLNKRQLRKKKQELSKEEFAKVIRKDGKKMEFFSKWMGLIFIVIIGGTIVVEIVTNSLKDGLSMGVLLILVETPIYLFFKKTYIQNTRVQLGIIDKCEELDMSIVEYNEILKRE